MPAGPDAALILIEPDGGSADSAWVQQAAEAVGLRVEQVTEGPSFGQEGADDTTVLVIVLAHDLEAPLAEARRVRRSSPLAQLVFLAQRGRSPVLDADVAVVPSIGNYWTVVDAGSDALPRVLADAARSARQRLRHRTTVTGMNVRLRARREEASSLQSPLVVSDRFLANVLEYADDAIITIDRGDRIASWNRGAARMFGHTAGEIHGTPIDALVGADHAGRLLSLVHAAWSGESARRQELECRRFDGERFTVEGTLAPIQDEAGQTVAVSFIARDVTERRRHEAQVRALALELEERLAAEREANAALTAALEELEAKERQIERLQETLDEE